MSILMPLIPLFIIILIVSEIIRFSLRGGFDYSKSWYLQSVCTQNIKYMFGIRLDRYKYMANHDFYPIEIKDIKEFESTYKSDFDVVFKCKLCGVIDKRKYVAHTELAHYLTTSAIEKILAPGASKWTIEPHEWRGKPNELNQEI